MNPQPQSGFWSPSPWYLAQVVHVLAGAAVMLAAEIRKWNKKAVWIIFATVTAAKEFGIDLSRFEGDTLWGSWQDWVCYQIGAAAGELASVLFWWGVGLAGGSVLVLFVIDLVRNADWSLPYD